ncbi:MAG: hypothetical protein ACM3XO_13875, partial [Bacteroidota bacterium]
MKRIRPFHLVFVMFVIASCSQAPSLPAPGASGPQAAPTTPVSTPTSGSMLPAGWVTHTSQQCEYAISYPTGMQVSDQNPYSQTFAYPLDNSEGGARNFIYVSVIAPEVQNMVRQGVYDHEVYNYDPAATDLLLNMQVGESQSLHENVNVASGFTYLRQPDTTIGGQNAQAYENVQPWEFPVGTKEIRYYASANGCIYLIGGYMDTTG